MHEAEAPPRSPLSVIGAAIAAGVLLLGVTSGVALGPPAPEPEPAPSAGRPAEAQPRPRSARAARPAPECAAWLLAGAGARIRSLLVVHAHLRRADAVEALAEPGLARGLRWHAVAALCGPEPIRAVRDAVALERELGVPEGAIRAALAGDGDDGWLEWVLDGGPPPFDLAAFAFQVAELALRLEAAREPDASLRELRSAAWCAAGWDAALRERELLLLGRSLPVAPSRQELGAWRERLARSDPHDRMRVAHRELMAQGSDPLALRIQDHPLGRIAARVDHAWSEHTPTPTQRALAQLSLRETRAR